jgi:tRNA pseudouridine55 synthase
LEKEQYNNSILLIDKPYTWTSFDVVNYVRKMIGFKVGHAGTLDPLATGLLVLCTGSKTKEINNFVNDNKTYEGTFVLGATTPSFDLETQIEFCEKVPNLSNLEIEEACKSMIGVQAQQPPLFSAKIINGERAYLKARRGENVEIKANEINILSFEVFKTEKVENTYEIDFKIECSKGTYIRAVARDLALRLNTKGYLKNLRRTQSGNFKIENSITIDFLKEKFPVKEKNNKSN